MAFVGVRLGGGGREMLSLKREIGRTLSISGHSLTRHVSKIFYKCVSTITHKKKMKCLELGQLRNGSWRNHGLARM